MDHKSTQKWYNYCAWFKPYLCEGTWGFLAGNMGKLFLPEEYSGQAWFISRQKNKQSHTAVLHVHWTSSERPVLQARRHPSGQRNNECYITHFHASKVQCDIYQWRIQDFPRGGRQLPKVLLFFNFLPKTAWKWKNLDPGGGARPWRPPWIRQCLLSKNEQ